MLPPQLLRHSIFFCIQCLSIGMPRSSSPSILFGSHFRTPISPQPSAGIIPHTPTSEAHRRGRGPRPSATGSLIADDDARGHLQGWAGGILFCPLGYTPRVSKKDAARVSVRIDIDQRSRLSGVITLTNTLRGHHDTDHPVCPRLDCRPEP